MIQLPIVSRMIHLLWVIEMSHEYKSLPYVVRIFYKLSSVVRAQAETQMAQILHDQKQRLKFS